MGGLGPAATAFRWPLGIVEVSFDPRWLSQGPLGLLVSWQGLAAAAIVLAALLVGALATLRYRPARAGDVPADAPALRRDDLLFIAVAVVPGAVVVGRVVYGLDYLNVFASEPAALLDPARGSLSLLGAVVGGTLTAAYIARILEGGRPDWRRWLEVAAPILLFLIVGAKFSQFLGGAGQGQPWTGQQAVAFLGPGPWQSVAPALPSVPAQLLEAAWAAAGVLLLAVIARRLRFGTVYLWALAWWLVGRVVIGFTWRDDPVVGPLGMEQLLGLVTLGVVASLLVMGHLRARAEAPHDPGTGLAWPEGPIDPTELPAASSRSE